MTKHLGDKEPLDTILRCIEEYWEFGLPKDYRLFLLHPEKYQSSHKLFKFKNMEDGSCIDTFFGFKSGYDNNILVQSKYMANRIPENMLAIARDVYGNKILLAIKNPDYGKIFFWDHEQEANIDEGEKPDYSNLTLLADSFEEFLSNLHSELENDLE